MQNKKVPTSTAVLKQIKAWSKNDGNTQTKLANKLGYTNGNAINNWIARKSVPAHQRARVLRYTNVATK